MMIALYVTLIFNKRKTINQVPEKFRQEVIDELLLLGLDENGNPIE